MSHSSWVLGVFMAFSMAMAPVYAKAEAILTIVAGDTAVILDRSEIAALDTVDIVTGTDWTNGTSHFTGPLVRDVLRLAVPDAGSFEAVIATAANDYSVEIPASDFQDYDVILAMTMDGERLTLRDKGPLWIVYPRDDYLELREPLINSRWIWQLVKLELK